MKLYLLPIFLFFFTNLLFSQENIATSGGNATGSGSSSYTIGQLFTATNVSNSGSVLQGIQQSIELFTLANPNVKSFALEAITFPNPTKDNIILSISNTEIEKLVFSIFDIHGRLLKKENIHTKLTTINIKNFPTGIYLLKVHHHKKQLKVFKIIKN
ncbi:hypothetical protein LPB03_08655 [Polaribacter vadi]|uniref:Secretion system C-terminal sorting domain-containing protein n=1 Tax=Polaribacter vadi TaxID=1774273 RepID=A0A1B8TZU8_9FLAO|nr:T9SS type A sorting domain-containing protein [Polaribacter vadi]AOW17531.1 hypothetical protein LPB03_08655 [Polaribacter vadi]OBY65039.1 hypothetical protein LPB3_05015 [Polaribacter vadi]